jgi:phospholipid/cholesterol/gamma-HCH transport system substrate-binding protein
VNNAMKKANVEIAVGIFVLVGIACLVYLAVHLGEMELFSGGYEVSADFDNISGLKVGASVEIAGVGVGRVEQITMTPDNRARLLLKLSPDLVLKEDTIASIRTKGIIGDKFVKLSMGNSEKVIPRGGKIHDTESAVELEELIAKFIHGKV